MLSAILFVLRTGLPWRDLPERYGPWSSVYARYRRWCASGLFARMLAVLAKDAAGELRQKPVLLEERAPLVIQEDTVGLKGVLDGLPVGVLGLQGGSGAKEVYSEQRRFAALPGEADDRARLCGDVIPDIRFQPLGLHAHSADVGVEFFPL